MPRRLCFAQHWLPCGKVRRKKKPIPNNPGKDYGVQKDIHRNTRRDLEAGRILFDEIMSGIESPATGHRHRQAQAGTQAGTLDFQHHLEPTKALLPFRHRTLRQIFSHKKHSRSPSVPE